MTHGTEADIERMFQNTPALLYRTLADGTIVHANEACVDIFGCASVADFVGRNAAEFYDDPDARRAALATSKHDAVVSSVVRLRRPDGSRFWALDRMRVVNGDDGRPLYADGCLIDITERVNQEFALHVSERLYRELVDNASDIIYTYAPDGAITSMNRRGCEVFGYTEREMLEKNMLELIDPTWRERARRLADEHSGAKLGEREPFELLCRHADGHAVWVEVTSRLIQERGKVAGVQAIARDVTRTRRRRAEEALFLGLLRSLNDAPDVESALRELLGRLCEAMDWPYGEAWVRDRDGVFRRSPAWYGNTERLGKLDHLSRNLEVEIGRGMPGRAIAEKRPVWQPRLAEDPEFVRTAAASSFGLNAGLAIPVAVGDDVAALLIFMMQEGAAEEEQAAMWAAAAASQLGVVMQRHLLVQELAESSVLMKAQIEGSREAILVVSAQGDIIHANERFLRLLGRTAAGHDEVERAREDPAFMAAVEHLYTDRSAEAHDLVEIDGLRLRRRSVPVISRVGSVVGRVWYFDVEADEEGRESAVGSDVGSDGGSDAGADGGSDGESDLESDIAAARRGVTSAT